MPALGCKEQSQANQNPIQKGAITLKNARICTGPYSLTSNKPGGSPLPFKHPGSLAVGGCSKDAPRNWLRPAICLLVLSLFGTMCENAGAQGALTNGWTHTGTIAPVGDSDTWTFSATAGDSIVIRVGKITQTNTFTPRIRLFKPGAVQQAIASGSVAAEIAVTATNTGTFTVIVDDLVGTTATGTYRLTLAKTGDPVVVSPGDHGGPMTNDVMHLGTIATGDLDVWTFSANSGDAIIVRVGEITATNSFTPWVRLYGPNGKLLDSGFGAFSG